MDGGEVAHSVQDPIRPPLWSRGNVVVSHVAGPGSIPGRGFSSNVRQLSGNLGHIRLQVSFGHHHHHPKPYSSVYGRLGALTLHVEHAPWP